MAWNAERVQKLRELWDRGLSASQIAPQVCNTRNAVIGKARRLGLAMRFPCNGRKGPRSRSTPHNVAPRVPSTRKRERAVASKSSVPPDSGPASRPNTFVKPVAFENLNGEHCRWPLDDGHFCGDKPCCRGHGIYCEYHAGIAYVGIPRRDGRAEKRAFVLEHPSKKGYVHG